MVMHSRLRLAAAALGAMAMVLTMFVYVLVIASSTSSSSVWPPDNGSDAGGNATVTSVFTTNSTPFKWQAHDDDDGVDDDDDLVLHLTIWNDFWGTRWEGNLGPGRSADEYGKQPGDDGNFAPERGHWYCPKRCAVNHDRRMVAQGKSSAVIMHSPTWDPASTPVVPLGVAIPWVMLGIESPFNDGVQENHPDVLRLFQYKMSYRLDSDFLFTYSPRDLLKASIAPPLVPVAQKVPNGTVAWMSSSCQPHNHRQLFVAALMKHYPVHSMGTCENNYGSAGRDIQNRDDVNTRTIANYRFYLSLENTNCRDYVTEKFFNAIKAGVVPIVNGPRENYAALLPVPDAAIYLSDYASLKDLVDHLHHLSTNDTAYKHMLRFRAGVEGPGAPAVLPVSEFSPAFLAFAKAKKEAHGPFCQLCLEMHRQRRQPRQPETTTSVIPDDTCFPKGGHPFAQLEHWERR